MSYTIDVYRGHIPPSKSLLDFALYVTFFPQLIAGPIVRAHDFLQQCWTETKAEPNDIGWGMSLFTLGLFQKIVLADALLSPVADKVYSAASDASFLDAWLGTLAFSGQIFFDFSGYSLIAIGVAMGLGFALPDNFRFPYAAIGFSDFWRRWHISLSSWLRDYLYISLSGNRKGSLRTYSNLMLTMLIGGLWHGASWLFVIWGALHGLFLICERLLTRRFGQHAILSHSATQCGLGVLTYILVCIGWVFFRASDLPTALQLIQTMFVYQSHLHLLHMAEALRVVVVIIGLLLCHWYLRDSSLEDAVHNANWWSKSLALSSLLVCIALTAGDERAFIYFDF
jgi:D-alanyl-lipoteichoic acid acyltransferase DltB (MBOAT superfamily)